MIVYSALVLLKPESLRISLSGWKPAVAMDAAGGIVGGFSAFPGSIPVVYLWLRGLSKTPNITQPYILALQLILLSILALTRPPPSIRSSSFFGADASRSAARHVSRRRTLSAGQ